MRLGAFALLILCFAGCHVFAPDDVATVVLAGKVYRGPIMPVCQNDAPCDAPFAATFEVRRGSRRVATFTSNADGTFNVGVPPGELLVIPYANAPLMNPTLQVKSVVASATGTTIVDLYFDTGIR